MPSLVKFLPIEISPLNSCSPYPWISHHVALWCERQYWISWSFRHALWHSSNPLGAVQSQLCILHCLHSLAPLQSVPEVYHSLRAHLVHRKTVPVIRTPLRRDPWVQCRMIFHSCSRMVAPPVCVLHWKYPDQRTARHCCRRQCQRPKKHLPELLMILLQEHQSGWREARSAWWHSWFACWKLVRFCDWCKISQKQSLSCSIRQPSSRGEVVQVVLLLGRETIIKTLHGTHLSRLLIIEIVRRMHLIIHFPWVAKRGATSYNLCRRVRWQG